MNLSLSRQIIMRYLRGKGTANIVPLLSRISMVAIAVASCAMIILLSVFNGLGNEIKGLYKAFYSDIRIVPEKGKFFSLSQQQIQQINAISDVVITSHSIEDNALMNNEGSDNMVVTIKGIDNSYFKVNDLSSFMESKRMRISPGAEPEAIVGSIIMNQTGMKVGSGFNRITLYYPDLSTSNPSLDPGSAFQSQTFIPVDTFRTMDEFDSKYILAPISLVQQLLQAEGKYSILDIRLRAGADPDKVKKEIQELVGDKLRVETRYEQNRTMYLMIVIEKWAVYAILLLVLLIASFNMIGALSLLVLEKQKDIGILKAMGAQPADIKTIFIGEGVLWSSLGGLVGLLVGLALCFGQAEFKWIKITGFLIDAFPVSVQFTDVLLVVITIILTGIFAGWYPARKAVRIGMAELKS
jgi:lipoprotein-releasing system permease protein